MRRWCLTLAPCIGLWACGGGSPEPLPGGAPGPSDAALVRVVAKVHAKSPAPLSYAQRRGRRLYQHYCVVCHGEGGAGDGFNAYNLAPVKPRDLSDPAYGAKVSDRLLAEVIREGGLGTRRSVLMPAWGNTLDEGQIEDVVAYLRALVR